MGTRAPGSIVEEDAVELDDMILISIDDHVVEPPDMFEGHVPRSTATTRRGWCAATKGIERWMFQGRAGRQHGPERGGHRGRRRSGACDPTAFAEMRPGAYDVHERVRDMNRNGVLASMCFPTFGGFSAGAFNRVPRTRTSPRRC